MIAARLQKNTTYCLELWMPPPGNSLTNAKLIETSWGRGRGEQIERNNAIESETTGTCMTKHIYDK